MSRFAKRLALMMLLPLLLIACQRGEDYAAARAYRVTKRSQLIGGPKALGNIGDYIIENDRIRLLINGHATDWSGGGVNKWGGAILDADIQRPENFYDPSAGGEDRLLELMPIMDVKTFGVENLYGSGPVVKMPQDAIEILDDGSDGDEAAIKVSGAIHNLVALLKIVPVPLSLLPVKAETVYRLREGDNWLKIETTFMLLNRDGSEPEQYTDVPLHSITADDNPLFSMFTGDAFGDAVFFSDSVDVIGPGVFGFSAKFYTEDLYNLGQSTLTNPPLMEWSAGVADEIGYALVSPDAPLSFPIMEDFLTIAFQKITEPGYILPAPGCRYSYSRYLVVDEGDAAGLLNHVIKIKNWKYGTLKGNVIDESTGEAVSGAKVLVFPHPRLSDSGDLVPLKNNYREMVEYLQSFEADAVDYHRLIPYSRFITDGRRLDAAADGDFDGNLPVNQDTGEAYYLVMASGPGNVKSELVPLHLKAGDHQEMTLVLPATGKVKFQVINLDPDKRHSACKVVFMGVDGEGTGDPFLGEKWLPVDEAAVVHTNDGIGEATLPPGAYRMVADHGPEHSSDEQIVTVHAMETREATLYIDRVVDTSGWVAADLHLHSDVSPDSSVAPYNRVLSTMVMGLEVIASTDHDFIRNYRPALEELGGPQSVLFLPGDELSHFSYAHFNGYPLRYDQKETSGGAPNWRMPSPSTSLPDGSPMPLYTPQDCFDALRERGDRDLIDQDPIVIVNHPEESFTGYLRAFGFDQYYATFGSPDFLTLFDPVVNNGKIFTRDATANFSWDFDGIEVLNAKRWHDFRTATEEEVPEWTFGQPGAAGNPILPVLVRTGDEQLRLLSGDLLLDSSNRGMIDDYMTLLAIGKRVVAVGNSDSHTTTTNEPGACRTYVMSTTDDPAFIDPDEFITNLKAGRAIVTTGPFMEMWVNGAPIGADITDTDGEVNVRLKAQAPDWMSLDRIEIYGNGILIGEIGRDATEHFLGCDTTGKTIHGRDRIVRFDDTVTCRVAADTFILAIGIGYEGMTPHASPIDGPAIEVEDSMIAGVNKMLEDWLGISNLVPSMTDLEKNHPIYPYAMTNAIFVDTDGLDADGDGWAFDGPGYIPGWFDEEDIEAKSATNLSDFDRKALAAAKLRMLSLTSENRHPE